MADLIDRLLAINEAYPIYIDGESFDVVQVETLMGMPSADAVEVIRCENCTHRNGDYCHRFHDGYSAFIHYDDFCSYGKRS